MTPLFIEYANADLEKNPEDILMVLEAALKFNRENAGPQDPYQQNINFLHHAVFNDVINTCVILHPQINSSYPYVYAGSETNACTGAFKNEFILAGERDPVRTVPFNRDTRRIALEGSIFWATHKEGCDGCNFNQAYERDQICGIEDKKITCLVCDQRFFMAALHKIIFDGSLDALAPFRQVAGRIINTNPFPEGSTLKACSCVDPCLTTFEPDSQQFSTFIMGVVGHDLILFLTQDSSNIDRIGTCRNCGDFFVKHDLRMVNCLPCIGKETKEAKNARQWEKRKRQKKNKRKAAIEHWVSKGEDRAEVEAWSEEDLYFFEKV
jgi:hypothetical protein